MYDLETFFGPSERSKGAQLLRKDQVMLSSTSDTGVRALVKGSAPARVNLLAEEVADSSCTADCSCPQGKKGELCKHIWAVILKLEETGADFLEGKTAVQTSGKVNSPEAEARQVKAAKFKTQQRERLKERNKEIRQKKKREERGPKFTYPEPVQESLSYFAANGFAFEDLNMTAVVNARKVLSRVFHPDKGGTHDEVLELNAHFDCLQEYLES